MVNLIVAGNAERAKAMVNTSKILTVSYGTFSCTLEGFDDSFDTMKAIAEYFRDLAADDRYFGAEPPTPDADMLARIAEREIARRVEAYEDQGKIHLRAEEEATQAAVVPGLLATPQSRQVDDEDLSDPETVEEQDFLVEDESEVQPVEEAEDRALTKEHSEETSDDDIEQELEVAEDQPDPIENHVVQENEFEERIDPEIAAFMADAEAEEAEAEAAKNAESTTIEDDQFNDHSSASDFAEDTESNDENILENLSKLDVSTSTTDVSEELETIEDPALDLDDADGEDIAAKLERIRSVATQVEPVFIEDEFSEDEHAQDFVKGSTTELDAMLGVARDFADEQAIEPDLDSAAETLEQAFSDDLDDVQSTDEKSEEPIFADEYEELAGEASSLAIEDVKETPKNDELEQLLADATPNHFTDTEVDQNVHLSTDSTTVSSFDEIDLEFEDEISDDSVEQQVTEPLLLGEDERVEVVEQDLVDASAEPEMQDTDVGESTLSAEDEADLLRELAEVEAELEPDDSTESLSDAEEDVAEIVQDELEEVDAIEVESDEERLDKFKLADDEPEQKPRGLKRLLGGGKGQPEEDAERLFDETDAQMDNKDATLRRNAIQHLRAAVAATRAEKKAGGKIEKDVDDSAYRSDLAEVVRPRRPSTSDKPSERSARPEDPRPAPLKLVAEQRVDIETAPVRPRRVSAGERSSNADLHNDSLSGFADFAQEMGATELSEILEAAAAYMSDIEGRSEFSRPMLMSKLKEVKQDVYSREDGLRSFGELLRGGKLQKLRGGRFSVTEETEFRTEARNAG